MRVRKSVVWTLALGAMLSAACQRHRKQDSGTGTTTVSSQKGRENPPRVVIRPFGSKGIGENEASTLANKFCTELTEHNKAELTCPGDLGKVLEHKQMQMLFGQCEAQDCLAKVGEVIQADLFLLVTISKMGQVFLIQANLADGTSGEIRTRISHRVDSSAVEDLLPAMAAVADKVAAEL